MSGGAGTANSIAERPIGLPCRAGHSDESFGARHKAFAVENVESLKGKVRTVVNLFYEVRVVLVRDAVHRRWRPSLSGVSPRGHRVIEALFDYGCAIWAQSIVRGFQYDKTINLGLNAGQTPSVTEGWAYATPRRNIADVGRRSRFVPVARAIVLGVGEVAIIVSLVSAGLLALDRLLRVVERAFALPERVKLERARCRTRRLALERSETESSIQSSGVSQESRFG